MQLCCFKKCNLITWSFINHAVFSGRKIFLLFLYFQEHTQTHLLNQVLSHFPKQQLILTEQYIKLRTAYYMKKSVVLYQTQQFLIRNSTEQNETMLNIVSIGKIPILSPLNAEITFRSYLIKRNLQILKERLDDDCEIFMSVISARLYQSLNAKLKETKTHQQYFNISAS